MLGTRGYVAKLREEYAALVAENAAKPARERLPPEAFEIDPGLRELVEEETEAKMELMRKSLAWETEKATLGLAKLQGWFLNDVEAERVVLRSFAGGRRGFRVTNFRVGRLRESVAEEARRIRAGGDPEAPKGGPPRQGSRGSFSSVRSRPSKTFTAEPEEPEEENPFAAGHKQELRRLRRKAREAEWRAFHATKPDANNEDADDVAAIETAKATMGDYKLKSAPDFAVAEEESMNFEKKRAQMVLLEEAIRDVKMDFNARFAKLRDARERVVEQAARASARVAAITVQLDDAEGEEGRASLAALAEPLRTTPLADEYPTETRAEITDEQLAAFDEARKAKAAADAAKAAAKAGGGFGGGGQVDAKKDAEEEAKTAEAVDHSRVALDAARAAITAAQHPREAAIAKFGGGEEADAAKLRHERAALVAERGDVLRRFDDALRAMRRDKARVEGALKTAEMKKLTYNQELVQLKKFEDGEKELKSKLEAKIAERDEVDAQTEAVAAQVEDKLEEVEGVKERKKKVLKEFDSVVDDSHAHREYLEKTFLRRIKRKKPKDDSLAQAEREDNSGSDSEESSDDDDDDDDDFDSDEEEEEARPTECDEALWDQVLALREKRQDQDDVINAVNRACAELKKESDALAKKGKNVGKALAALEEEMAELQREKQETMNAIERVVPLRLRQAEYLHEGRIPNDLAQGIVFSRARLERLHERIDELVREKAALRRQQRDLRREHVALQRARAEGTAKNRALDDSATRMQMLKFGGLIDLEKLERAMIPKKGIEEVKVSLEEQELANREEMRRWHRELAEAKDEVTKMTAQNTACLNAVADLTRRHRDVEAQLKNTQRSVFVDPNAARRVEARERDRLVAVVNAQAKEIDTLKAEIGALSVKGRPQTRRFFSS